MGSLQLLICDAYTTIVFKQMRTDLWYIDGECPTNFTMTT